MNKLMVAADFVRKVRWRMRFGELSRAPLRLLRLELREESAECDWLMRPADPWDQYLPRHRQEENRTLQALRDALQIRELLFSAFADVRSAELRVFRDSAPEKLALIMTGTVSREDEVPPRVDSVVMRAKLCGFRFSLGDGVLEAMNRMHSA